MGWNRSYEDWQADHYRDERKHEPRPGDRGFSAPGNEPPARLDIPMSTAMDIVVAIKTTDNYPQAAAMIEDYARSAVQAALLDRVSA